MALPIKFVAAPQNFDIHEDFFPRPAKSFLPEWYKKTPSKTIIDGKESENAFDLTIKHCMPVLDSLTAGYIIPLWTDIFIKRQGEDLVLNSANDKVFFQLHPKSQNPLHPHSVGEYASVKFVSPWSIVTPKGYSCLFVPPFHNPNKWVRILEGIVDTDIYHEVNFPSIILDPEAEGIMSAGMPLVQVIPFKRDKWKIFKEDIKSKKQVLTSYSKRRSFFIGAYKHHFWNRKNYD